MRGEGTFAEAVANRDAYEKTNEEQATTICSLNTQIETLTTENQNYSTKVEELEGNISTLTTERDNVQAELHSAQETVNSLNEVIETERSNYTELDGRFNTLTSEFNVITAERDELATFKKDIVDGQKKLIISEYAEVLSVEVIDTYTNNMDNYSIEELDMRLAYECKKINPTIFSKNTNTNPQPQYVPKDEPVGNGINDILARYEKK